MTTKLDKKFGMNGKRMLSTAGILIMTKGMI
jgi:hypothetical protein